jgi:hypothetical protein
MADMTNTGMNYDAVFKEAMTLFKGKALDFLGLSDLGTIEEPYMAKPCAQTGVCDGPLRKESSPC